uniref:Uncharacterized protein n=1 Tax=Lepeophtheirus salmonis TaxID=72036 RepID=A0A0K2VF17_LEPSM
MAFVTYMVICTAFDEVSLHFLVENHSKFSSDRSIGVIPNLIINKKLNLWKI